MKVEADTGISWIVPFAALLTNFFDYGIAYSIGLFYDEFLDVFRESGSTTAWISSLNYGIMCATGPLASLLIDKFGCRVAMAIGAAISFASLVVSSFATSVYFLIVTLGILTGAGLGMSYMGAMVVISYFFSKYRAIAMGVAVSGGAIGTFIFPLLNQYLLSEYSWRGALLINGAIHLHVVLATLLIPAVPPLNFRTKSDPNDEKTRDKNDKPSWINNCNSFMKNFGFILFCLNNFVYSFGHFIVYTHIAAYARTLGSTKTFGSLLLSIIGIASLLGRLILTAIAQLRILSAPTLYSLAFIIAGSSTTVSGIWNSETGLITTAFIFGFFSSAFGALTPETTCHIVGVKDLSKGYGIAMLFVSVGIILGPPIAGFIFDKTGYYPASFYFGGVCMVLSAFILAPVWMKCKKKANDTTTNAVQVSINE